MAKARGRGGGFCGSISRFILGLINVLLILAGIAIVVGVSLLRWGNIQEARKLIDFANQLYPDAVNGAVYSLLVLGALTIVLGIVGLIGVITSNRVLLLIYEAFAVFLFLVQAAALIVLLVLRPQAEQAIDEQLTLLVKQINGGLTDIGGTINNVLQPQPNNNNNFDLGSTLNQTLGFVVSCTIMQNISAEFGCCGSNGPNSISLPQRRAYCCGNVNNNNNNNNNNNGGESYSPRGCSPTLKDILYVYSSYYMVIPAAIILLIELTAIIIVPFFFCETRRTNRMSTDF